MVQVFAPSPRAMQQSQIGQSIGQGIGLYGQQQQMQQQQGQLAKALFGDQGQQFAGLPMQEQLKAAQFMQSQNQSNVQNQQFQQNYQQKEQLSQQNYQQKMQENMNLLRGIEKQRNLPEGSLNAYVSNPQMAEQITNPKNNPEIENLKKEEAKTAPYKIGLGVLEKMKALRKKGNLGRGSSITGFFDSNTARDRGEYEQLGKSLISLSTNIPIRNRIEFETLAEKLYDPSIPDAEAEGILNAMETILKGNIGEDQSSQKNSNRPPLSSFAR